MKKSLLFLGMTLSLFAGNNFQNQTQKENAFFTQYDANGDNRISQRELPLIIQDKFFAFDTDGSGYITREELRNSAHATQNGSMRSFNNYDRNRDAIISKHEMGGQERQRFYTLDFNGDGVVTRKEFNRGNTSTATMKSNQGLSLLKSKRAFEHFDRDNNGLISIYEMSRKLKKQAPYFDTNGDSMLNLQEYRQLLTGIVPQRRSITQRSTNPDAFDYYDTNGDGILSKQEVSGKLASPFYAYDLNGDNTISPSEFMMVQREQKEQENQQQDTMQYEQNLQRQQDLEKQRDIRKYDFENDKKEESPYY